MALSKIDTNAIADDAVDNTKLDLASNYDFTGTVTGAGESNVPAFAATSSSQTGISSGTSTKMQFDTEIFDSASAFDHSTNYRFTVPSGQAGKYVFMFSGKFRSATLHKVRDSDITLRKNGSTICSNNSTYNQNLALQYHTDAFFVVDASVNDYFEVYGQATIDSGTLNMSNGVFLGYKLTV